MLLSRECRALPPLGRSFHRSVRKRNDRVPLLHPTATSERPRECRVWQSRTLGGERAPRHLQQPNQQFWSASGINPVLFAVYPDLEYDSYATIGLDGPANESDIPGATDPSAVGEAGLSPFFTTDGAIELNINDSIGSSWFILSDADNGLPDDDLRVLIMQVSTAGEISGQLNYQVFDGGEGASAVYVSVLFDGAGAFGWNNECACNGIPEGDCDCDGNQLDALGVCGGDCAADIDDDGNC